MSHGSTSRLAAFSVLYVTALIINNAVNLSVLEIFGRDREGLAIAFVIATGITAALNFTVMKLLIFRPVAQTGPGVCSSEE